MSLELCSRSAQLSSPSLHVGLDVRFTARDALALWMEETESAFLSVRPVTGSRMNIEIDVGDIFFDKAELPTMKVGRKGQNSGFSLVKVF